MGISTPKMGWGRYFPLAYSMPGKSKCISIAGIAMLKKKEIGSSWILKMK
jgi:hypothetical protein